MTPDYDNDEELDLIELDGENYEIVDTAELDGKLYVALIPYDLDDEEIENGDSVEFTILEMLDDPDDEENCILKTIDDEELYDRVGEVFIEKFGLYDEEDDGEE